MSDQGAPKDGRSWWPKFSGRGAGRKQGLRLHVPPQPPLLSPGAIQGVLRDVALLLDYVNRLPETRLDRYFVTEAPGVLAGGSQRATPPCSSHAYFLGRIAAIAAKKDAAQFGDTTEPSYVTQALSNPPAAENQPATNSAAGGSAAPSDHSGRGEAARLADLPFLIWSRDFLCAVAWPATLDTIRVTRAFRAGRTAEALEVTSKGEPEDTADVRDIYMARYGIAIANRVSTFRTLAMFLLWFSLYLSFMVYSGQVLMHENAALQAQQASLEARVRDAVAQDAGLIQTDLKASTPSGVGSVAQAYCQAQPASPPGPEVEAVLIANPSPNANASAMLVGEVGRPPARLRLYLSDRQRALCEERETARQRERELKQVHGMWLTAAGPVMVFTTPWPGALTFVQTVFGELWGPVHNVFNSLRGAESKPHESLAEKMQLETHRYGMQQMINGLLGGMMPAMYAALGALASLFRRLGQKAECERLGPADHGGMMGSLVLGVLTGAVIGLFVTIVPQGSPGAGLPLTTTALALLAGYAADRVFVMFDNLAERVFVLPGAAATPGPGT